MNKLIASILLIASYCSFGQYHFKRIGISQGLSQNSVHCTFQDSDGYIWLGTQDGLNRFDSYSFKTFRHDKNDSSSISDNFITSIIEDKNKDLWIGTRNGLNKYDRRKEKFIPVFAEGMDKNYYHNAIHYLSNDKDGNVIFASYGKFYFIDIERTTEKFSIVKMSVDLSKYSYFYPDRSGNLYLIGPKGIYFSALANQSFTQPELWLEDPSLYNSEGAPFFYADQQHRFWLVTGKEVKILNAEKRILKEMDADSESIICMKEDNKNNIWLGGNNGITIIGKELEKKGHLQNSPAAVSSLSRNSILNIYKDKQGLMWIGTAEGGVNVCDPQQDRFKNLTKQGNDPNGLSDNAVWAVLQDGKKLFLGTENGLNILSLRSERFSAHFSFSKNVERNKILNEENSGLTSNSITAIEKDSNGNYWIGSRNKGISVIDANGKRMDVFSTQNSDLCSNTVFHILSASDGKIWISTPAGLNAYDPVKKQFAKFLNVPGDDQTLAGNYVISVFEDSRKTIWISTTGGLSKFDPVTGQFKNYLYNYNDPKSISYSIVTSCMEDSKSRFWVTTLGGGINLFDRQKETFTAFSQAEGLSNSVVYCALEDNKGRIWLSTNNGVSFLDPQLKSFSNYTVADGLVANEFSQNGAFRNSNGELFFASPEGLMVFDPDSLDKNKRKLNIILSDILINYNKKDLHSLIDIKELSLAYSDKVISFEFTALNYLDPEKVKYSYKLEGFDNDWNPVNPGQRIATYTSLPFGDYIFLLRGSIDNQPWESTAKIAIHVIPPFWLSWWFMILASAFTIFLVVAVIRYYYRQKIRKHMQELEMQRKLQVERDRISRDLHDNVGSHLTYIITTLDNISIRMNKNMSEQTQDKIESLGDFARSTMQQLRETIWAISKELITLGEFRDKVKEHLTKVLSEGEVVFDLEYKGLDALKLKPSQAIHLFRIVQEAVNNSMKHSQATTIFVGITVSELGIVTVIIKDNGIGISKGENETGHYGLENMNARAIEMGAEFILTSQKGMTEVKVILPV